MFVQFKQRRLPQSVLYILISVGKVWRRHSDVFHIGYFIHRFNARRWILLLLLSNVW